MAGQCLFFAAFATIITLSYANPWHNASDYLKLRTNGWVASTNAFLYDYMQQLKGSDLSTLTNFEERRYLSNQETTDVLVDLKLNETGLAGINISSCLQPYNDFVDDKKSELYLQGLECSKKYQPILQPVLDAFKENQQVLLDSSNVSARMIEQCYTFPQSLVLKCRESVEPMAYDFYKSQIQQLDTQWDELKVVIDNCKYVFIGCSTPLTDAAIEELWAITNDALTCADNLLKLSKTE